MKAQHIFFLLLFSSLLLNSKCRKENEPQLPPETTTGANTFGCKINGKAFVPKGNLTGPSLNTNYYFLGNGLGGGWFLFVTAANRVDEPGETVFIETDSLLLTEGISYSLRNQKGSVFGRFSSYPLFYKMNNDDAGNLFVTKHDVVQRILSGKFSFTATNQNGEKVTITDGRFDVRY